MALLPQLPEIVSNALIDKGYEDGDYWLDAIMELRADEIKEDFNLNNIQFQILLAGIRKLPGKENFSFVASGVATPSPDPPSPDPAISSATPSQSGTTIKTSWRVQRLHNYTIVGKWKATSLIRAIANEVYYLDSVKQFDENDVKTIAKFLTLDNFTQVGGWGMSMKRSKNTYDDITPLAHVLSMIFPETCRRHRLMISNLKQVHGTPCIFILLTYPDLPRVIDRGKKVPVLAAVHKCPHGHAGR